jgi:outer membrane protein assembly factor BamB
MASNIIIRILVFCVACTTQTFASDWTRFRGPNGTGVSADRQLPAAIDRHKNVVWSAKTPGGNSSPIIAGRRVFLTAHEGDQRVVLCYNSATGKRLWRKSITRTRTESFHPVNGPATPTPASDGRNIFVFFPEIGLIAYDRDGNQLWRTPLGPFASIQGMAASPLYTDGRIALLVDTPYEAYLAAFDAKTGKQAWRTERSTGVLGSYATPTCFMPAGEPTQIVVAGSMELTGYEAKTGERLWWARGVTVFPQAPPFVVGDSVYTVEPAGIAWPPFGEVLGMFDKDKNGRIEVKEAASDSSWAGSLKSVDKNLGNGDNIVTDEEYAKASTGESQGGGLIRTRIGGQGDVSSRNVVWRHTKGMPSLTGALLYQNVLYVIRNGIVSTFDPETGKLLRQERVKDAPGDYYASPVAGDGKIYLANLDGKVTVLKAKADWQILSTGDLDEQVIATPAIADARVYIRTATTLYCFGVRRQ